MTVTAILPVTDETASLRKTVEILLAENPQEITEILIVACQRTTPAALAVAEDLGRQHAGLIQVRFQQRPFLGGAIRDAFEWASGSHVLMMASDLETDPATVKELIAKAKDGYDIVTATRWKGEGGFRGYNPFKRFLNGVFQTIFRVFYGTTLSDLTYGFRIFKKQWVKTIAWEELRHAFLLETMLKPLRLGARVIEIPSAWRARTEGGSHNPFWENFVYFRIAFKTRFRNRRRLLKANA
ncbi:MAG: glycosyltransferase family 2 protein [Bryobacteraceae bacterium]|jgi:glycosyltransferase involved in cell wall biosynthesis